jgi:flagellar biosynthesis/type III secretory pathway protein FliH
MADAIAKAKTKAIEIKDQALEEGKNTGFEDGFQKGFQEGENKAKEECGPLLETLNSLLSDLGEFRKMMYPKVEKEMVEIVVGLTKKILRHELSLREDSVKQMILLAMDSVVNRENMTIRIHPSDKKCVEEFRPELKSIFAEIKNITFEENSSIERGGCVIETNFGTIDAGVDQLEAQIEKILNLAPDIPKVNPASKTLSGDTSETEEIHKPDQQEIEKTPGIETGETSKAQASPSPKGEVNEDLKNKTQERDAIDPQANAEENSEKPKDLPGSKKED